MNRVEPQYSLSVCCTEAARLRGIRCSCVPFFGASVRVCARLGPPYHISICDDKSCMLRGVLLVDLVACPIEVLEGMTFGIQDCHRWGSSMAAAIGMRGGISVCGS